MGIEALQTARQKLVAGTEVLRTGGGCHLTVAECNALLDRLSDLQRHNGILMRREVSLFTGKA